MPSRNFHHKSRHGCSSCKRRRKKCDGSRPRCGGCTRLGLTCNFQNTQDTVSPHSSHQLIASPISSLCNARTGNDGELELVFQFLARDSSFVRTSGLSHIRQNAVLIKFQQQPYLFHGILATSLLEAQHLRACTESSKEWPYTARASLHRQRALSSFIPALAAINIETCHAVFAFATMLAGMEFALMGISAQNHDYGTDAAIKDVVTVFGLLRGALTVADAVSMWDEDFRGQQRLFPVIAVVHPDSVPTDVEIHEVLDCLGPAISSIIRGQVAATAHEPSLATIAIYESVIAELRNVFNSLEGSTPRHFFGVLGWATFVDPFYIPLLEQRDPAALVLLAHYSVALHALRDTWWLRGVGSKLVRSIAETLKVYQKTEWLSLLEWPLQRVGMSERSGVLSLRATHMPAHVTKSEDQTHFRFVSLNNKFPG